MVIKPAVGSRLKCAELPVQNSTTEYVSKAFDPKSASVAVTYAKGDNFLRCEIKYIPRLAMKVRGDNYPYLRCEIKYSLKLPMETKDIATSGRKLRHAITTTGILDIWIFLLWTVLI